MDSPRDRSSSAPTLIVSVQRALRLLEAVAAHPGGAVAKALARDTGFPLATTYHLLRTLAFEGYLRRLPDGVYVLSDGIPSLLDGERTQAVVGRIRAALATLRDETRAAAYLSVFEHGEIVLKEIVDGPRMPRVEQWVGFQDAAHATALGKAVLGALRPDTCRAYLSEHPLHALTPRTITDRRRLLDDLVTSVAQGVAIDREEYAVGTLCVASPVFANSVVGALAISLPARRRDELAQVGPVVRRIATRMSMALSLSI